MTIDYKSLSIGLLVLLTSFSGASLFSVKLYRDIYHTRSRIDGLEPAGTILQTHQIVKRKFGEAMVWDYISTSDPVYWNDAIQTGSNSGATLALADGNQIRLGDSSLVIIEKDSGGFSLNLKSGEVLLAKQEGSTNQKAKATKITINGVVLEKKADDNLSLKFDDKDEKVVATASESSGVTKQITVQKDGKVEEKVVPTVLNLPAPLFRHLSESPNPSVEFSWQSDKKDFQLLVATDSSFANVVAREKVSGQSTKLRLPAGKYYWKVSTTPASGVEEVRGFEIVTVRAPELKGPDSKSNFLFRTEAPTLEFTWESVPFAYDYTVEFSNNSQFSSILNSATTNASSLKSSKFTEGEIFWRVTANFNGASKTSSPSRFTLTRTHETAPPLLVAPNDKAQIGLDQFSQNGGISFRWESKDSETHQFVLAKTSSMKDIVFAVETKQNFALLSEAFPKGSYFWGVAHKDQKGSWVFEHVRQLDLDNLNPLLAAPKLVFPENKTAINLLKQTEINWKWEPVPGAKEYRIKVVRLDGNTKSPAFEETIKSLEVEKKDLPDGNYNWSVVGIDEFGRESKLEEKSFSVNHGKPPRAPSFEMETVQ